MNIQDDTRKRINRRYKERDPKGQKQGLDQASLHRTVYGHQEPIEASDPNCTRGTSDYASEQRDTDTGKILERLEALEENTLAYLHAHQQRLEQRLEESKRSEAAFRSESAQIKSDILGLALVQSDTSDELDI
jgi:hypothetical protein